MGTYATMAEFDSRTRDGIRNTLLGEERFLGAIDSLDALVPSRRTKLVLTDRRLIEFERGLIRYSTTDYDLDRISNVSFDRGVFFRKMTVNGSGFVENWYVPRGSGQQFASAIRNRRNQAVFTSNRSSSRLASSNRDESSAVADQSPTAVKELLQGMDDYDFEYFVADLWSEMGWTTEVSQASVDAGIDVIAVKQQPYAQKTVIQAKRYGERTTVGGPDIQQYASLRQQVSGADSVAVVTTGSFTNAAENRAQDLNVKLVDGDDLVALLESHDAYDLMADYVDVPRQKSPRTTTDPAIDQTSAQRSSHRDIDRQTGGRQNRNGPPRYQEQERVSVEERLGSAIATVRDAVTDQMDGSDRRAEGGVLKDTTLGGQVPEAWYYGIIASLALWVLALFTVEVLSENLWGVLFFGAWLGHPYATYRDIRAIRRRTDAAPSMLWVVGAAVWFVNLAVGFAYLHRRPTYRFAPEVDEREESRLRERDRRQPEREQ